jgi:hypothetical protein
MIVQHRRAHLEIGCFVASLHRRQLEVSDVRLLHHWFARLLDMFGNGCRRRHCARLNLPVNVGGADRGAAEINNNNKLKINPPRFDQHSALTEWPQSVGSSLSRRIIPLQRFRKTVSVL